MYSCKPLVCLIVVVVVLIAILPVPETEACFASGVCGGGGQCAPPPPPVCSGGCGQGYGCGQYGCYRMRARVASSKTLRVTNNNLEEDLQAVGHRNVETPDEKFMACCQERGLPDACLDKCTFKTFTRAALQNMYFRVDQCPMQAAADMQFCAAQGRDHRECCYRNGVAATLAGDKYNRLNLLKLLDV